MNSDLPKTIEWLGDADGHLRLLDQTKLPIETTFLDCRDVQAVFGAIRRLSVRGAPAIGVSAAYGVVIGLQSVRDKNATEFDSKLLETTNYLAESRPTAVNLFWALDRMKEVAGQHADLESDERHDVLLAEARQIQREDFDMCAAIGKHGADALGEVTGVLTHCNTGSLATAGDGTALSVIFEMAKRGTLREVYADETRPLLQGGRLTAWELQQRKIPAKLICDSMAGWVMKQGRVGAVITGADRIAANGDAANKIGTYMLSVLAKHHDIPFYIAAPSSTFDFSLESGKEIPIEERAAHEVTHVFGTQIAPEEVAVYNPAFDVVPAELIRGLITEKGVISPVTRDQVKSVLCG